MSKKVLYLECQSGISGDMTVAALLNLGADAEAMNRALNSLPVAGFRTETKRVEKSGLDACDFSVILDKDYENHDHDMEYLHGHGHHEETSYHEHTCKTENPLSQVHTHKDENPLSQVHTRKDKNPLSQVHTHEDKNPLSQVHSHEEIHIHAHEALAHAHVHIHEDGSVHSHTHEEWHTHTHSHTHEESHTLEHEHPHSHSHEHSHDGVHSHANEHSHDGVHSHSHEHTHDSVHSHTHEHSHDGVHSHANEHSHDGVHSHSHEHTHDGVHYHVHEHRTLPGVLHILSHADMPPNALALATKIFRIIGAAESKAHGVPMEQVHFHEVGAVDSIVDITAVAVLLDSLHVDEVIIPELCEGQGWVRCQHGVIPVPVPAVVHIAEAEGLVLRRIPIEGELVTPTGAAIAAAIRTGETLPTRYRILKTGIGAGKRKYERPSLLRAMLLEPVQTAAENKDVVMKLESNVDDCSGETLGYVMDLLLQAGARDVHYTPVFMKKNRPAYQINVLCSIEDTEKMEDILFRETTTIGIRRMEMERTVLSRRKEMIHTEYGEVGMKICGRNGWERAYPEYEDLKVICRASGMSYPEAYQMALECWKKNR